MPLGPIPAALDAPEHTLHACPMGVRRTLAVPFVVTVVAMCAPVACADVTRADGTRPPTDVTPDAAPECPSTLPVAGSDCAAVGATCPYARNGGCYSFSREAAIASCNGTWEVTGGEPIVCDCNPPGVLECPEEPPSAGTPCSFGCDRYPGSCNYGDGCYASCDLYASFWSVLGCVDPDAGSDAQGDADDAADVDSPSDASPLDAGTD